MFAVFERWNAENQQADRLQNSLSSVAWHWLLRLRKHCVKPPLPLNGVLEAVKEVESEDE